MAKAPNESALVAEVRAAGHQRTADKLAALEALHMVPESGQHRELTAEEIKAQSDNALNTHQHLAAQAVEYGTYVAAEDIYAGAVIAYPKGAKVPISNVERHGYEELGLVERVARLPETKSSADAPSSKAKP